MDSSTPCAPSMDASSSGELIALPAACTARPSPREDPMPISALPAPDITDLTSAKSRLIRPGVVIRFVMPWTPESSTSSAERNASISETPASPSCSSRSFGMTISVSHSLRSAWMPSSACPARRRPSKVNGRVTTPMVSAPSLRAIERDDRRAAGAGAAALARGDEDHVGPLEDLLDLLAVVLGGLAARPPGWPRRPGRGSAPGRCRA